MVLIFIVCLCLVSASHLYFSGDCPSLLPLVHFSASILRLARARRLVSFGLVSCLSPVLHFSLALACHPSPSAPLFYVMSS